MHGAPPAPARGPAPSRRRWLRAAALAYAALLGASYLARLLWPAPAPPLRPGMQSILAREQVGGDRRDGRAVRLAYRDHLPEVPSDRTPAVLIHGSPGSGAEMEGLGALLSRDRRVVIPDLPGFGRSGREIPDYSARAHAGYVLQLLDALGVERAHLVGFSLGGAVALEAYDLAPERTASVVLLSATAVQELELLGDHRLNHLVHLAQLALLWAAREGLPHFGALDGAFLGVEYARNFTDTDQRRLRGILERFDPPMLIVHGEGDPLVPAAAAIEHHRVVPQSELALLPGDHFLTFLRPGRIAGPIADFLDRADRGAAVRRAAADPERAAAARRPFDPASVPPAGGLALLVLMAVIASATLVSEDLTCIGVGLLVAQGRIGFAAGTAACFAGIWAGDVLLYLAGRIVGRPVVARAPLRWVLRPDTIERASRWFSRRGPVVVAISRFLPGARLPTYVAAGILRTSFAAFTLWFVVAAAIWTPILVGLSAGAAAGAQAVLGAGGTAARLAAVAAAVGLLLSIRIGLRLLTHGGRRRLAGAWRRWTRWEFWPPWLFYPPVVLRVLASGLRHRGLTTFTAANPAMPAGGFVGESKAEILGGLAAGGAPVARFERLPAALSAAERLARARAFLEREGLGFPVVLKPDAGQRGDGVAVIRDDDGLRRYLERPGRDVLIQEHVAGREFGVFYARRPDEERGRIFSITEKRLPAVTGDGRRTLERLILDDRRAVAMARAYEAALGPERLQEVPRDGEEVTLVEIGTHCRGAVFLDGGRIRTPALEEAVDRMSRVYTGFFFGRYDLIGPSEDAFRAGRDLRIVELNGVTSESTDIYDPGNSLLDAYRILFRQWRLAFEIGAANRRRGVQPTGLRGLLRLIRRHRKRREPASGASRQ
jgi:pimeloyl-ACP methyl ester carboxylesterase/membrane protein DedA with SNARE-associated domain